MRMRSPIPAKPIRFVLPFPTGSATDQIARIVGKDMAETLGQPIVVENKPGAGGAIAAEFVAKSPPDGYTLFVGSNTQLAANPSLFKTLSYDPVKDFAPVVRMTTQPSAFLVRPGLPGEEHRRVRRVREGESEEAVRRLRRVERAGRHRAARAPGRASRCWRCLTRASRSRWSTPSAAPSTSRSATWARAIAQVKGGKLKSLGVTSEKRNPLVPDWPTVAETYPGFDVIGWHTIVAPANTPRDIRNKLYDAAAKALAKKE